MKKILLLLFVLILNQFFSVLPLFSQAAEEITEGKEYWIGLPFCGREVNEAIRGDVPVEIWISSKVKTIVTISDDETGSVQNVSVLPNKITVVKYGDNLMNKESEVAHNYGIHVVSNDPVSVSVYTTYMWSGEAWKCTPVDWLGIEYVTLNMYQDQLTQNGEIRPPQILIIATDDNTKVNYTPSTQTAGGVKAGQIGSVNLMKGQTFLIFGSSKQNQSQQDATDLTGTYITSNKPIAVLSGHTKAAFPRFQFTFLGRNGGFMRNMFMDQMLPVGLLGSDYVSAPIKYQDRVRGQIQDDLGDLIRFVPVNDNTIISQMSKDGSSMKKISPVLKRGQWYDIVNQEDAAFYTATNSTTGKKVPVLVGQYGKTWWLHAVTPDTKKTADQGENPSRSGQGMQITLSPVDHWASYSVWRSPPAIDDFVYVTFRADQARYIRFDGLTLQSAFGNCVKNIEGTPYAYITESVSSGDHWLTGDTLPGGKENVKFGAYAYGNWDRSKDGFAYGYPVCFNYSAPCDDSLFVTDTMMCGNVTGNAKAIALTTESDGCAVISAILLNSNTVQNYDFEIDPNFKPGTDKTAKWTVNVSDAKKYALAEVRIINKSGKFTTRKYEYFPEQMKYEPLVVDFGMLKVGDSVCGKTFKITNEGTVPITVNNLKLKNSRAEFQLKINSIVFPFTLKPGESKTIETCAHAIAMSKDMVYDFVVASLNCYDTTISQLKYVMGEPVVYIGDAQWGALQVGSMASQQVQIMNLSDVDVVLNSISWPDSDKAVFPKVDGLSFPIDLTGRGQMVFTVWYNPQKVGTFKTRAIFTGNTTINKLYSDWNGSSYTYITPVEPEENYITPNPASDFVNFHLNSVKSDINIKIMNILGNTVIQKDIDAKSDENTFNINIKEIPSGVYFCKISGFNTNLTYKIIVIK